jgi:glutathione S-transferase
MIDLYYWPTPNGHKITIFLEETATPYKVIPINIRKGEQFEPSFLKISPNNRMPAIVDHEGPGGSPLALFESGAILMYLAEKTGKLMPTETRALQRDPVADVPKGGHRTDDGSDGPFQERGAGKTAVRDRALHQ